MKLLQNSANLIVYNPLFSGGKIFLAVFICFFAGCASYGDVYVAQDRFKQAKIVTLEGSHFGEEQHSFGDMPKRIDVIYSKAQKPGIPAPVEMKIVMVAQKKTDLRNSGAVLIDSATHDIQLINVHRTMHVSDNPRPNYPGDTITSYTLFGTMVFAPELWQKMLAGQDLAYQLFLDQKPYTFKLKPEMFQKLRIFHRQ